jgi:CHAD domain-containing protein
MSFEVKQRQTMARNIQRLLKSQCARAIRQLENYSSDPAETIHKARIVFKRIRTLLHLIKKSLHKPAFQYFNYAFRDLGIALSTQRDSFVKSLTLHSLELPKCCDAELAHAFRPEDKRSVEAVLARLYSLLGELSELKIEPKGFNLIKKGAIKIYRDGKAAMRCASLTHKDEDFHEWRKNAKHLYHLVSILQPLQPGELTPLRDELYILTQLLGEDHDLSMLKCDAKESQNTGLVKTIRVKQEKMRIRELQSGEKLYWESEYVFIQRLEHYWHDFRRISPI